MNMFAYYKQHFGGISKVGLAATAVLAILALLSSGHLATFLLVLAGIVFVLITPAAWLVGTRYDRTEDDDEVNSGFSRDKHIK
jgi:hypothetical protein